MLNARGRGKRHHSLSASEKAISRSPKHRRGANGITIGAASIFRRYVRSFLAYWLLLGGRLVDGCMPPPDRLFSPPGAPEPVVVGRGGA